MFSDALIKEFQTIVGKPNVLQGEADRQAYSYDAAVLEPVVPALAVCPQTSEALGQVVRVCNQNGIPLTPRGSGTNLSGGTIPERGGIVLLTNALNKIIEINTQDLYAVVQPGVVTARFAAEVARQGLFYPPDPGSMAVSTLGGNVAENAGGLRGLKYGVTKDYVMGVDFFDVNGELVKSGSRTVKCVTGLNLSGLQVASEGTLGVFNEIVFKLVPPPAANKAMMAVFDDIDKASETVAAIIAAHIVPCTLEILDHSTIKYVEDYTKAGMPVTAQAILLIEVDGHPVQVAEEAEKVVTLCKKAG
ncbi:FAD-binding oxidoreductase, partial [Desulfosarcina cetonica]|uniref:FAD-binding oxidoreductase n=1 Tax=Desulfosarcina cetonica TaxID=90730 RepID=UPI0006D0A212